MTNDDAITPVERYARAVSSTDLSVSTDSRGSADVLLAAGAAAAKGRRRALALTAYRAGVSGDTSGLAALIEELDGWLQGHLKRNRGKPVPRGARLELIRAALRWWFNPTCGYCEGRMYVVVQGAARLSTVQCEGCHGSGKRPLEREVPRVYADHARWLTDELTRLVEATASDMEGLTR